MSNPVNYTDLFNRMLERKCSPEEAEELVQWLSAEPQDSEAARLIRVELQKVLVPDTINDGKVQAVVEECLNRILNKEQPTVHRIHFLKTAWFRYAAAVVLIAGSAAIYWLRNSNPSDLSSPDRTISSSSINDIQPGTNRAVLTIGDQKIDLATNKTGIAVGHAITYNDGEKIANAGQLLQLTTPRGGQYQAVLPDGSKVWLNAASSIKFPSKFTSNTREVKITGEAYLEIAKNTKQPFIVRTNKTTIQVLGTSFNINAYEDEPAEKTTLIEGSVKVQSANSQRPAAIVLQPGQQATVISDQWSVVDNQSEAAIAWKNGIFNFNNATLTTVMRQLERWYDVEIVYEKNVPDIQFWGKMKRDLSLSQVLQGLGEVGVKFRIEGKKLIVTP